MAGRGAVDIGDLEAEAASAASGVPSDAASARLRAAAEEVLRADAEVTRLEGELKRAQERRTELVHVTMPGLMEELRQDRIGMPDWGPSGADLVLEPYYRANIGAEWEPERRDAAFAHLEYLGAADIVKNVVSLQFSRGSDALMRAFLQVIDSPEFQDTVAVAVRQIDPGVNDVALPPTQVARSVPWTTLTAFVREWTESAGDRNSEDPQMDLEKLGAVVGSVVKIKPRKAK